VLRIAATLPLRLISATKAYPSIKPRRPRCLHGTQVAAAAAVTR